MTPLRQQMLEALQLKGLSERTHQSYIRTVQKLAAALSQIPGANLRGGAQTVFPLSQK
jgi:hypothetical protein